MHTQSTLPIATCEECGVSFAKKSDCVGRFCSRACRDENRCGPAAFWRMVDKSGDCWIWKGALSPSGYGKRSVGNRSKRAHRVAYEITYGPIPDGLIVCHSCDNPPCVRPDHLWLGTLRDNSRDCWAKGRHPKQATNTKLTPSIVTEMRSLYAKGGISITEVGRRYGVRQGHASRIINRKQWVDLP